MTTKLTPQIGLQDEWVEDDELLDLLENRETFKKGAAAYRAADKAAKGKILSLGRPGPFRCGRFMISCIAIPPRSVTFDTADAVRVNIKTAGED